MSTRPIEAIVIGASAGALDALTQVLTPLPADYPLPLLAVVHLPADKKSILAELLDMKCRLSVKEGEDKEPLAAGVVYVAPPDYHMLVEKDGTLSLSSEEPVLYSRPSIDVLFESAADAFGPGLVGVILTGANEDGAHGLATIREAGGRCIVQRPHNAYASTMPLAALQTCNDARTMSLPEIAEFLKEAGGLP
ncbi:chemotaxis protein CheB [Lacipirellula parvula]|uniref:protein-glutamate methylesterase n=1 Tax=Lacipirellula parvula TaxID=2650471 RepID=A0A5K7XA40_9BACT|nr:chemotaxis protein CheB [Lacipirellula parvula]BBO31611.1 chemotaxis response regulator protein-glutamate methylesterase CheB [Lacipirellula parvula]